MSSIKLYLLLSMIVVCWQELAAQELYYNQFIGSNKVDIRDTDFDNYSGSVIAIIGLGYSDTLTSNWDYKTGIDYTILSGEGYFNTLQFQRESVNGDTITLTRTEGDYYESHNVALTLGGLYWPKQKRKGFYIPAEFISVVAISAELQENRISSDVFVERSFSDVAEDYTDLHFHLRTGLGYKLIVYKGLSISAAYHVLFRFGKVVKEVDDAFAINRGISLIAGYKF